MQYACDHTMHKSIIITFTHAFKTLTHNFSYTNHAVGPQGSHNQRLHEFFYFLIGKLFDRLNFPEYFKKAHIQKLIIFRVVRII